jgi:hypothetical protein
MPTLMPAVAAAVCNAVATAVREHDTPLSAWPDRYPGRWATAARVSQLAGVSTAQLNVYFRELILTGRVVAKEPWPGRVRGYQLVDALPSDAPLFTVSEAVAKERVWLIDELNRWASLHRGRPPRQKDWTERADPEREWPRWVKVAAFFEAEALEKGVRYFVHEPERCAPDCACSTNRHVRRDEGGFHCIGCFDCLGHCPYGGHWVGPSGWQYALECAGLR